MFEDFKETILSEDHDRLSSIGQKILEKIRREMIKIIQREPLVEDLDVFLQSIRDEIKKDLPSTKMHDDKQKIYEELQEFAKCYETIDLKSSDKLDEFREKTNLLEIKSILNQTLKKLKINLNIKKFF